MNGTVAVTNHTITIDRDVTGVRTFDMTNPGVAIVTIHNTIGTNQAVVTILPNPLNPGQHFDVRITVFSGSSMIHFSAIVLIITLSFSYLMK